MAEISYIKQNEPRTYAFFMEYWGFLKKYWNPSEDEDWWNFFVSDLAYYVSKYESNDFFVDLIMQLYIRNKNPLNKNVELKELTSFLREWWCYINKYWSEDNSREWWDNFIPDTKELTNKYKSNEFFANLVDLFVQKKAG